MTPKENEMILKEMNADDTMTLFANDIKELVKEHGDKLAVQWIEELLITITDGDEFRAHDILDQLQERIP